MPVSFLFQPTVCVQTGWMHADVDDRLNGHYTFTGIQDGIVMTWEKKSSLHNGIISSMNYEITVHGGTFKLAIFDPPVKKIFYSPVGS